jgi:hypothetical protein
MRPVTTGIALVALTAWLLPGTLFAQTTPISAPEFSGVWTMDRTRSESAAQEQPAGDIVVTIAETAATLKIETNRNGSKDIAIYPIEAQPSDTTEGSGKRHAYRNGSVLVDEGSVDINGQTIAFREGRTLSADGAEMVVETTLKVEHGYDLKGAQTIVTGKNVYVRSRRGS